MKVAFGSRCGSKIAYPSKRDASADIQLRRKHGHAPGHAYECPICGCWHVSHWSKVEWRRRMRRGLAA